MKLHDFNEFINEAVSPENVEKAATVKQTIGRLNRLVELGMIDDHEANRQIQQMSRDFLKSELYKDGQRQDANSELLIKLGEATGIESLEALNSAGAVALKNMGLHMVSTIRQLVNGNLIWSLDPDYHRGDGWAIGFFSTSKIVRRMTPKHIQLHRYPDVKIANTPMKFYPSSMAVGQFLNEAMLWAAENVDFEQVKMAEEEGDPQLWRYYTKRYLKSISKNNENS